MNQRTINFVATGAAVLLIGALVAGLFWLSGQVLGAGAKPAPAVSASAPATAAPPTGNPLAVTQHSDFIDRMLGFEEAYQNRYQPGGLDRLAKYVSPKYLQAHTPPPGSTETMPAQDLVITLSQDLKKTIVVRTDSKDDPSVRYISITPTISTSQKQADGKLLPVETDRPTNQVHAFTVRKVNGIWLADQDR